MKLTTLCYPVVDGRVLLAMKKRGMGAGKWNGPGGKVEDGETIEDACRRETLEEVGLKIGELEYRGIVRFVFEHKPAWDNECHVYVSTDVSGEAKETEEMRPAWYSLDQVPYAEMWEDDLVWLPGVLAGGRVEKTFRFDEEGRLLGSS